MGGGGGGADSGGEVTVVDVPGAEVTVVDVPGAEVTVVDVSGAEVTVVVESTVVVDVAAIPLVGGMVCCGEVVVTPARPGPEAGELPPAVWDSPRKPAVVTTTAAPATRRARRAVR